MLRDFSPPRTKNTYGLTFLSSYEITFLNEGIRNYCLSYQFIRLPDIRDARKIVQQLKDLPFNQLRDELYRKHRKHYYELYRASRELMGLEIRERWFEYFNLPSTWISFKKDKVNTSSLTKLQLFYRSTFAEELIPLDENLSITTFNAKIDELYLSWLKHDTFACHSSFGLREAADTLLAIEESINSAINESARKPWFMPQVDYRNYRAYLVDYQKQLEAEKIKIAEAMLRRLQIALNRPGKDDVIEYLIYDLAKFGADLPKELLEASRQSPEYKGLTPELAGYFRFFIEQCGNSEHRRNLHEFYSFIEADKFLPLKILIYGKHELIVPAQLASCLPKKLSSEDILYLSIDPSIFKFMRELHRSEADVSDNGLVKYINHCNLLNAYLSMALAETQSKINQIGFFTSGKTYKRLYLSGIINFITSFQSQVQNLSKRLEERKQHQTQDANNKPHEPIINTIRIKRNNKEFLVPSRLESLLPLKPRILESIFKDAERINFFQTRQSLLILCEKPLPRELYDRAVALEHLRQHLQDELEQCFKLQKRLYFWQAEHKLFLEKWALLLMEKINVLKNEGLDLNKIQAVTVQDSLLKDKHQWELNFKGVIEQPTFDSLYRSFKGGNLYDFEIKHYLAEVAEAKQGLDKIQSAIERISADEISSLEELKNYIDNLMIWLTNNRNALKGKEDFYNDLLLLMDKKAALKEIPKINVSSLLELEESEANKLFQPIVDMDEEIEKEMALLFKGESLLQSHNNKNEWKIILNNKFVEIIRYKFNVLHDVLVTNRTSMISESLINLLISMISKIDSDVKKYKITLEDYEQNLCTQYMEILQHQLKNNLCQNSNQENFQLDKEITSEDIDNVIESLKSIASGGYFSNLELCRKFMYQCHLLVLRTNDTGFLEVNKDKLEEFNKLVNHAVKQAEFFYVDILSHTEQIENGNVNAFICFGLTVKFFGDEKAYGRHIGHINLYITKQANYILKLTVFNEAEQLKLQAFELVCAEMGDCLKKHVNEFESLRQNNRFEEYKSKLSAMLKELKSGSSTGSKTSNRVPLKYFNEQRNNTAFSQNELTRGAIEMGDSVSHINPSISLS